MNNRNHLIFLSTPAKLADAIKNEYVGDTEELVSFLIPDNNPTEDLFRKLENVEEQPLELRSQIAYLIDMLITKGQIVRITPEKRNTHTAFIIPKEEIETVKDIQSKMNAITQKMQQFFHNQNNKQLYKEIKTSLISLKNVVLSTDKYYMYYFLRNLSILKTKMLSCPNPRLLGSIDLMYSSQDCINYMVSILKAIYENRSSTKKIKAVAKAMIDEIQNLTSVHEANEVILKKLRRPVPFIVSLSEEERAFHNNAWSLVVAVHSLSVDTSDYKVIIEWIEDLRDSLTEKLPLYNARSFANYLSLQEQLITEAIKKSVRQNPELIQNFTVELEKIKTIDLNMYRRIMLLAFPSKANEAILVFLNEIRQTTFKDEANESYQLKTLLDNLLNKIAAVKTIDARIRLIQEAINAPVNFTFGRAIKKSQVNEALKPVLESLIYFKNKMTSNVPPSSLVEPEPTMISYLNCRHQHLLSVLGPLSPRFKSVLATFAKGLKETKYHDAKLLDLIRSTRISLINILNDFTDDDLITLSDRIFNSLQGINDSDILHFNFSNSVNCRLLLIANIQWSLPDEISLLERRAENVKTGKQDKVISPSQLSNRISRQTLPSGSPTNDMPQNPIFGNPIQDLKFYEREIVIYVNENQVSQFGEDKLAKYHEFETLKANAEQTLISITINPRSIRYLKSIHAIKHIDLSINFENLDVARCIKNIEQAIDILKNANNPQFRLPLLWLEGRLLALSEYDKITKLKLLEVPLPNDQVAYYCALDSKLDGVTQKIAIVDFETFKARLELLSQTDFNLRAQNDISEQSALVIYQQEAGQFCLKPNGMIKMPKHGFITEVQAEALALNISRILTYITTGSIAVIYDGKPALLIPFDPMIPLTQFAKGESRTLLLAPPSDIGTSYIDNATIAPVGVESLSHDQYIKDFGELLAFFSLCCDTDVIGRFLQNKGVIDDIIYVFDIVIQLREKFNINSSVGIDAVAWTRFTCHDQGVNKTIVEDSSLSNKLDGLYKLMLKKENILKEIEIVISDHKDQIEWIKSTETNSQSKQNKLAILNELLEHAIKVQKVLKDRFNEMCKSLPLFNGETYLTNPKAYEIIKQAMLIEKTISGPVLFTNDGRPYKNPRTQKLNNQVNSIRQDKSDPNTFIITFKQVFDENQKNYLKLLFERLGIEAQVQDTKIFIKFDDLNGIKEISLFPEMEPTLSEDPRPDYLNISEIRTFKLAYPEGGRTRTIKIIENYLHALESAQSFREKLQAIKSVLNGMEQIVASVKNKGFCKHMQKKLQFHVQHALLNDELFLLALSDENLTTEQAKNKLITAFNYAIKCDLTLNFNKTIIMLAIAGKYREIMTYVNQFNEIAKDANTYAAAKKISADLMRLSESARSFQEVDTANDRMISVVNPQSKSKPTSMTTTGLTLMSTASRPLANLASQVQQTVVNTQSLITSGIKQATQVMATPVTSLAKGVTQVTNMVGVFKSPSTSSKASNNYYSRTIHPALKETFRLVKVPPDGSCLYTAVSFYLAGNKNLREEVADYLLQHKELLDFLEPGERTLEEYLTNVKTGDEFATHTEIFALMKILNRPIVVLEKGTNITTLEHVKEFSGDPIFVYFDDDAKHYDALTVQRGKNGREILYYLLSLPKNTRTHTNR